MTVLKRSRLRKKNYRLLTMFDLSRIIVNPTNKENKMAKKEKITYTYLEQWNTKNGASDRIVIRQAGRFVDNISLTALRKGEKVSSR